LVCEAVLPLGIKDAAYGKWSPNWHGPYRIDQVLPRNAYMFEELDGIKFSVPVNGQHFKMYFTSMWDDGQSATNGAHQAIQRRGLIRGIGREKKIYIYIYVCMYINNHRL
jgi:hypothetical protein